MRQPSKNFCGLEPDDSMSRVFTYGQQSATQANAVLLAVLTDFSLASRNRVGI
jgi:hypothetical protein